MGLFRSAAGLITGAPVFLIRSHFRVSGDSMTPGLQHGDWVHVFPRSWCGGAFARGAVVVARPPLSEGDFVVKRVVGLPGELVGIRAGGDVSIDDETLPEPYRHGETSRRERPLDWLCGDDEYFLMGDNRANSGDSRRYGPVSSRAIIGKVWARWPARGVGASQQGGAR